MQLQDITNNIKILNNLLKDFYYKRSIRHFFSEIYDIFLKYYLYILQKRMVFQRKFIPNIKSYFAKNLNEIKYTTLIPKCRIKYSDSELKFLSSKISCSKIIKKKKIQGYRQKEVFLCRFKNIKFFGHSGCISYKNYPIMESACSIYRLFNPVRSVDSIILHHKKKKGIYTSIMHIYHKNYYHWLYESLPRFYGLSKIQEKRINLIIPKETPKWQYEILKIFIDKKFKIIHIKENEVWSLEKFYFSSFYHVDCSGYIPLELLNFVKIKIFNYYNIKETSNSKNILISRNRRGTRRLLNEEKVFEILEKYNFEKVYPEELPFKKQIELFNSANIVVAVGGAALSNALFANNLKLLIIYNPYLIGTHFMLMCKALGYTHRFIIGENVNQNLDIRVDIIKLEEIIRELIKK